jgi:trehalose synthase
MASSPPAELTSVPVGAAHADRFRELVEPDLWDAYVSTSQEAAAALSGRTVWNLNSTAHGGGVAELLAALLPYQRGSGLDSRWLVIQGTPEFFAVTKRVHNQLHGVTGDGPELSERDRRIYDDTLAHNASALLAQLRPGDVVILHDPQTAGLIRALRGHGCLVVWRCHVGIDQPNDVARRAWSWLEADVAAAHAVVFSRQAFAWENLDRRKIAIIMPSIDPLSPKNQELDADTVTAILQAAGFQRAGSSAARPSFRRRDGSTGTIARAASFFPAAPPLGSRLVVQISRWDRLKDPVGVVEGFAKYVAPNQDAHLVVAGPGAGTVTDDPEAARVFEETRRHWRGLPEAARARVHLAVIPMVDEDENAVLVNALQRQAEIVVVKSLAEGFGLTAAEAMWKGRPVVASRVGGIQDQIEDGVSGILIDDPRNLEDFGRAVVALLDDRPAAERIGEAARRRVARQFLSPRQLREEARLLMGLLR